MRVSFLKMHGCGNDYLYVDGLSGRAPTPQAAAQAAPRLCARHTGVGADGIILLLPCKGADARMRMFNADGSEGAMCGNGVRCAGAVSYTHLSAVENNVEVYVGFLRKKLKALGSNVAIAAVRRVGYHLEVGKA